MVGAHDTDGTPTSLYRYYDKNDLLLYVGVTGRGATRNIEHNKSQPWWPHVTRQEVTHLPTRRDALLEEKRLIQKHLPPYNRQHNRNYPEGRRAYEALMAAEVDIPISRRVLYRNKLPLTPLSTPLAGDMVTLHSFPEHFSAFSGAVLRPDIGLVSTPQRTQAGKVAHARIAGRMLVVGIRGKYLPDEIRTARAVLKYVQAKPQGLIIKRILLNEPQDVRDWIESM